MCRILYGMLFPLRKTVCEQSQPCVEHMRSQMKQIRGVRQARAESIGHMHGTLALRVLGRLCGCGWLLRLGQQHAVKAARGAIGQQIHAHTHTQTQEQTDAIPYNGQKGRNETCERGALATRGRTALAKSLARSAPNLRVQV